MPRPVTRPPEAYVDLYWLPLGAGQGGALVRVCGRAYERVTAWREHRQSRPLFHAALLVHLAGEDLTVEMAPAWGPRAGRPGVAATGPVGLAWLGVVPAFRYEIRAQAGTPPDVEYALGPPHRCSTGAVQAHRLLRLVPAAPTPTWGRDELGLGEMWNSDALVAWLLAASGHDLTAVHPPQGGRAPGWGAGLRAGALARQAECGRTVWQGM